MPKRRVTTQQRRTVMERAQGCCEYCRSQTRFAMQSFSTEHIVPRSQDGETTLSNLALACQGCNNHKHTKTVGVDPVTSDVVSLYHPRRQRWGDHFAWNEDFTPTGRATVETLRLNRVGLVNLRRVLCEMGKHPPTGTGQVANTGN